MSELLESLGGIELTMQVVGTSNIVARSNSDEGSSTIRTGSLKTAAGVVVDLFRGRETNTITLCNNTSIDTLIHK